MAAVAAELLSLCALGRSAPGPFPAWGCMWLWSWYPPRPVLSALLLQGAWDCSQGFSTPHETLLLPRSPIYPCLPCAQRQSQILGL